ETGTKDPTDVAGVLVVTPGALHQQMSPESLFLPDMNPKQSIFSLQFSLLCLSGFLFFGSFNMIIPELPSYLESMGGGEYKGLIVSLFTLTAGLSRPLSGKLADKVGRIPV